MYNNTNFFNYPMNLPYEFKNYPSQNFQFCLTPNQESIINPALEKQIDIQSKIAFLEKTSINFSMLDPDETDSNIQQKNKFQVIQFDQEKAVLKKKLVKEKETPQNDIQFILYSPNHSPVVRATRKRKSKKQSCVVKQAKHIQEFYCKQCGKGNTPQRRKGPDNKPSLCNACGVHYEKNIQAEKSIDSVDAIMSKITKNRMNINALLN